MWTITVAKTWRMLTGLRQLGVQDWVNCIQTTCERQRVVGFKRTKKTRVLWGQQWLRNDKLPPQEQLMSHFTWECQVLQHYTRGSPNWLHKTHMDIQNAPWGLMGILSGDGKKQPGTVSTLSGRSSLVVKDGLNCTHNISYSHRMVRPGGLRCAAYPISFSAL